MPRLIDFGGEHGVISFPDDATDEQIVAEYDALTPKRAVAPQAAQLSAADYGRQAGGSFLRGIGNVIASIPEGLAVAAKGLEVPRDSYYSKALSDIRGQPQPEPIPASETPAYQLGQLIRKTASETTPAPVPELEGSFMASRLPEGVGSAVGFMGGGLAGAALRVPRWLSIAGLGSLAGTSELYQDAKASGADEDTARLASSIGGVVGLSEAIPLSRMMRRLDGITGGTFSKAVLEAGKDTLEEAIQEGVQQLAGNLTAQQLYDADRELFNDVATNTGVGGATGFLMSALTQALGIPIGRSRMRREGEARRRDVISKEVEQGNLLPERTQDATTSRAGVEATGVQTPQLEQETEEQLRLRRASPQAPLEAQEGAPVAQPSPEAPASDMVQSVVNDVTSRWQNAPPVRIVATSEQFPDDIKAAAAQQGIPINEAPAVFSQDGTVWLAANQISDPDHAKRLLLHEAVGHFGVESLFGTPEQFSSFMQGVSERHANTELGLQTRELYGNDAVRVGREVVAKLAENPEADPTLWQTIVATVRDWARRVFDLEVTDNDIKVLLSRGRKAVESGTTSTGRARASADTGTAFASEENTAEAPVVYRGFQPGFGTVPGFDLYNLTDTIALNLVKGSTVSGDAIRKAGFRIPAAEEAKAAQARPPEAQFSRDRPASPQTFQSRQQVNLAVSDPLLTPAKRAAAEALASVQSSMVSDQIMGNLMATPKDDAERYAQRRLDYLQDRRFMADAQTYLNSLPETTPDEKQAKEVAAAVILNHYGTDRNVEREINSELEVDQKAMAAAVSKIAKLNNQQIKANFLTSIFNRLVKDYRTYVDNLGRNLPAASNEQAVYRQRLADVERRLNEQAAAPVAVQKALSAIAQQVPDNLLTQGAANGHVISWALTSNVLDGVVGNDVRNWLLVDDGSGAEPAMPALLGYDRLIQDLNSLREVLANQDKLSNDIKSFERWFRPSGKTGKVPVARFAEAYFKFRTSRDRAAKLAAAMEGEIEDLDTRIRGNITARQWLQGLMISDDYVRTVREAGKQADVVVRAIYEGGQKTGLIERDKTVGLWRMQVPGGTEYIVDLHPSATTESKNQGNLKAFAAEARQYATDNSTTNPLLADEYARLADYIDKFLVHPALNPNQGFTQLPWIKIPGTNIRFSADPFGWTAKTIRDVLEKVGGRAALQATRDANELDTVMKRVDGINNNPDYGYAAQTQAVLQAMESHGWGPDQFPQWDERVAERVIAAGQNNLGPSYEVGDVIIGSGGARLTTEDVHALKLMKKWEDEVLKAAPRHIQDFIGKKDLGITRKAISSGQWTMARTSAPWTEAFLLEWVQATTDAEKLKLLEHDNRFRRVVMGYIGEFNPEFQRMNNASAGRTPFYDIFRLLARHEKDGVQLFSNMDQVLNFVASEMVSRNMAPDQITARKQAEAALLSDIKDFTKSFQENVVGRKEEDVWGAVPPAVVSTASARNSFTTPRGNLVAPSTFYTYSRASDGSRAHHVGSLRSLMNLKLLQSSFEMQKALEAQKTRMEQRADDLVTSGLSKRKAMSQMIGETVDSRKSNELRFDYLETINALGLLEKAFNELVRFEQSSDEHYQHGGVAALLNVIGTLKASLLMSPQAVTTNFWSGTMLGPAIVHLQTGRIARGITDFVLEPHLWSTLYKRLSAMVAGNPAMSKLLNKHAPLWSWMAKGIVNAANDWSRLEEIATLSGMVSPYNLSDMIKNKEALKTSAGRLESEEEMLRQGAGVNITNYLMSNLATRRPIESLKATTPRWFDNMVNYTLIQAFDYETDFLKKMGWVAFKNREDLATGSGADYRDLSNPDNILQPSDLRLGTWKALNRYREIFSGMGSLDQVLLDFYERTKSMTKEQRREEPLIPDISEHAAVALQYAAITNVATESNRPPLFKGKGSDGVWRNIAGTFMGWPINFSKQLAKVMQTYSKDPQAGRIWSNMLSLAALVLLLSLSGAWNWEFGDELTEKLFGQSSARIQPGNVANAASEGDYKTAGLYFAQSLVNTVPYLGPQLGGMLGVSYTGRGNLFDLTSWNPVLGWMAATWNTTKRISQTGDAVLPLADYTRQYVPLSRAIINKLPIMQGLVDQQNAVRALNASAPRDVEIKWGQGAGGNARYSPANDEVMKLISSAYDVALRGGDAAVVQERYQEAVNAYVKAGRTPEEAVKLVASALASKEPVRILTGREMTSTEESRWIRRMTPGQKKDYSNAVSAWNVLGDVTGRDLSMVSEPRVAGGSGGGGSYSRASSITGLRSRSRLRRSGLGRRSRLRSLNRTRTSRPKISRRRTKLGSRRRLRYALA